MTGAFISYHNTLENFGFEYVKTEEIERRIFGSTRYSDLVFVVCSKLTTNLMDLVLEKTANEPYKVMRLGMFAENLTDKMVVFAELFYDIEKWDDVRNIYFKFEFFIF